MQESFSGDKCVLSPGCWKKKVMLVEHRSGSKKPNGFSYTLILIYTWSRGYFSVAIALGIPIEINLSKFYCNCALGLISSDFIVYFAL